MSISIKDMVDILKEIFNFSKEHWGELKTYFSGKKLAIIGPTSVGKDTLYLRLQKKEPLEEYLQNTSGLEKIPTFTIEWSLPNNNDIIRMKCSGCRNVGGELEQKEQYWPSACKDSDIILYMISYENLIRKEYVENKDYSANKDKTPNMPGRVFEDLKWIASILPTLDSNVVVHLLVNKIDLNIADSTKYNEFIKENKEAISEYRTFARRVFGRYANRLANVTLISAKDQYLFFQSFTQMLEDIYRFMQMKS